MLNETPWVELVEEGCAFLVGNNPIRISKGFEKIKNKYNRFKFKKNLYGDGKSSDFICREILKKFGK